MPQRRRRNAAADVPMMQMTNAAAATPIAAAAAGVPMMTMPVAGMPGMQMQGPPGISGMQMQGMPMGPMGMGMMPMQMMNGMMGSQNAPPPPPLAECSSSESAESSSRAKKKRKRGPKNWAKGKIGHHESTISKLNDTRIQCLIDYIAPYMFGASYWPRYPSITQRFSLMIMYVFTGWQPVLKVDSLRCYRWEGLFHLAKETSEGRGKVEDLNPDLSNLTEVSLKRQWRDEWFPEKKAAHSNKKQLSLGKFLALKDSSDASSSYPTEEVLQRYEPPPPLGSPHVAPAAPVWKIQFDSNNNAFQIVRTSDMVRRVNLV